MTVNGVLFDFSGTLFRIESTASWLRTVLDRAGVQVDETEFARLEGELREAGALPGGPVPRVVPDRLAAAWAQRDRSREEHRAAYLGLAREVRLPKPELYEALYARHMEPDAWLPYPDATEVLAELRRRGVPVGVVSNTGWDLRPVFRQHGLDRWVDAFVLSYEHRVQKPDPRLFAIGCRALGLAPGQVLMVGDDARADGGAAALGCEVLLVEHRPVTERKDGLRPVLDRLG
ncbi:HAD family hydrolase [Streptomyces orinoci]|uniref:HAD-IA family hydrolase n=1 Tax=Streptomyces orinoci TaxID=67339 RepID=A0ABV3K000_STRON|nr:HAD-IA family hydrolase [Streptomyces orinoci]